MGDVGTIGEMRRAGIVLAVAAVLAALAVWTVSPWFGSTVRWTPDGLYYQARVLEIRGADRDAAIAQVFQGPLSERLRLVDPEKVGDPAWVAYNERFYERRQAIPLAGAAVYPLAGDSSLLYVSLAGYVATILALFGLLLLRFRLAVAAAVALATIFLPALVFHSHYPLTDSWGLALLTAALAGAILTLERSPRWLALWIGALFVLSFTRDSALIAVLAAAWIAYRARTRVALALVGTGLAAALPAVLLYRVSYRELLALAVNHSQPDPTASWPSVLGDYPGAVVELVRSNGGFVRDGAWYTAAYLIVGFLLLFLLARGSHGGTATSLMKAAAVVSVVFVLAGPVFSAFRLELVGVPMAAFGLALGLERVVERVEASGKLRRLGGAGGDRSGSSPGTTARSTQAA
ncbi:MAG TPA: hypothetical protein VG479_08080 [Gaiellaceae bacterium]|nr:hypothetical protein [Gaiellaceae bacterium]